MKLLYSASEMATWSILCFVDEHGQDSVSVWLNEMKPGTAKAVRRKLNWLIPYLEACEYLNSGPYLKQLKGYPGILELHVVLPGFAFRPLCCYGPGNHELTILVGATERGDKISPRSACDKAMTRKSLIMSDRRYVRGYYSRQESVSAGGSG